MAYPAKSQEEKNMQGTARNDRVTPDFAENVALETLPDPPSYLGKSGRKHWKKYTKMLQNQGILGENQLDSLGRYCMHLQIADEAAEKLSVGVVQMMQDEDGKWYYLDPPNVLKIFNEASAAALKLEQQFGFTPVSRKNVPAPKQKKESKLVKLMGGKR